MTAATLVKPTTCRRCKGTGIVRSRVVYAGAPGTCFQCTGDRVVEGDKATLAAQEAEAKAAEVRWTAAVTWFATQPKEVRWGYDALEYLEPSRAPQALCSIETGPPGVAAALVTYGLDNAERLQAALDGHRAIA